MIKTNEDLRIAYNMLNDLLDLLNFSKNKPSFNTAFTEWIIKETKREIRDYLKRQESNESKIIKEYGINGYIVLVNLPNELNTMEEAMDYFERNEKISCPNSIYDCTGYPFTSWYKIFKRRNRFMAYHRISFDV